jgi:UDP-N-acetyl-D-galactosamine dehydrogenase
MSIVSVVGLGYVGLPLAVEFGKTYQTIGFDLSERKIANYKHCFDPTGEVCSEDLKAAKRLTFTTDPSLLVEADYIIIAVPTPIDSARQPDLKAIISSSQIVGQYMKKGAVVIYESTVFPGATEEICVPHLERHSGLKWKQDFHVGYSPERINPGDKEHTLTNIVKVVSGDDVETLEKVANLYGSVIDAGVYRASCLKVAEAAKVIENTQRDLNIALMNELAIIFNRMDIDTLEVLQTANTKWNFLPFKPGLVGGHCIGVDPYYLTHKAEMLGYHPEVILGGRRINDGMGKFIAEQTLKAMINNGCHIKGAKVNVLGMTFKENCPDIRNSRVIDVIRELQNYGIEVYVHDPIADADEINEEYGLSLVSWEGLPRANAIVAAVAHHEYEGKSLPSILQKITSGGCFIDVKATLDREALSAAGYSVWRL